MVIMKYNIIFGEHVLVLHNDSKKDAIMKLDAILSCVANYSLMSNLNDMQMEACDYEGSDYAPKAPWDSKWTIPDYFINLVLSPYNVKIEKVK